MIKRTLAVIVVLVVCIFAYGCSHDNANQQTQIKENEKQLTKCASGEELKPDGSCGPVTLPTVCQSGEELKPDGTCGPVTPPVTCPNGQTLDSVTGQCVTQIQTPERPQAGTEGGACLPNEMCQGVLVCKNNICTQPSAGEQVMEAPSAAAMAAMANVGIGGAPLNVTPVVGEFGATCLAGRACNIGMKCDDVSHKCVGKKEWVMMDGYTGFPAYPLSSVKVGRALYIGTYGGGVYKSTDGGNKWFQTNKNLGSSIIYSLTSAGNDIYASTKNGVYKSADEGVSWTPKNDGLRSYICLDILVAGKSLYTLNGSAAIYRLSLNSDSDSVWHLVPASSSFTGPFSINGAVYIGTNRGVFKFIEDDESWVKVRGSVPNVTSLLFANNVIYAGTYDGQGVFRSSYGSDVWKPVNKGLPTESHGSEYFADIDQLILINNTIYALTLVGIFKFFPEGDGEWKAINNGLTDTVEYFFDRMLSINNAIYVTFSDVFMEGVFKFDESSQSWVAVSQPDFLRMNLSDFLKSGENLYAVGSDRRYIYNIYKWIESSKSWVLIKTLQQLLINQLLINKAIFVGNDIYIATTSGVFKSSIESGDPNDWLPVGTMLNNKLVSGLQLVGRDVYAGVAGEIGGVYKFAINSNDWVKITPNLNVGAFLLNGNDVYAGAGPDVFKFTIGVSSDWSHFGPTLTDLDYGRRVEVLALLLNNGNVYVKTSIAVFTLPVNGGTSTWQRVGFDLDGGGEVFFSNNNDIYTSTYVESYKFTIGSSTDWTRIRPSVSTSSLALFGNKLYAYTSYGVWVYVE